MLPDEVMEKPQISWSNIDSPKCNGVIENYDVMTENNKVAVTEKGEDTAATKEKSKSFFTFSGQEVVWFNVAAMSFLHISAAYSFITFPYIQRLGTFLFCFFYGDLGALGVTIGVHRMWTHRSFKATMPFRILLLCMFCISGQYSIYTWVRDHRVHHKFAETDADPHNSRRGFFFSHVGWLMLRRHPDVIKKGRMIDMSDVLADPVVVFGEKYFTLLRIFFCFLLPITIPVYFWNEDWYYAIVSQWFMRYALVLNGTWTVNSLAHMFGSRPFDKSIAPTENAIVAYITNGEGWHNYHHTFPWDYKAAEFGHRFLNLSTHLINWAAAIGWAYDLKQPSADLVRRTILRKGDGSHHTEVPMPTEKTKPHCEQFSFDKFHRDYSSTKSL